MLRIIGSFAFLAVLTSALGYGQSTFGDLHGVARTASGLPLPGVQIVVHKMDGNAERSAVSNDHGVFRIENLKPGRYQLTASKEKLANSPTIVVLAPQERLQVDLTLAGPTEPRGLVNPARTAETSEKSLSAKQDAEPLTPREQQLLARLNQLEERLAILEAKEAKDNAPTAISTQPAPVATPEKAAVQAAAPTAPILLASLGGTSGVKAAGPPKELQLTPVPVTPALPQPPAASVGGGSAISPAQEVSPGNSKAAAVAPDKGQTVAPFSDYDWTWLNGNPRTKEIYWDSKFFTPEIRADATYTYNFNHPVDHTMGGSSEIFRSQEVQLEQLGVGGDFHYDNVRARLMTQFGMYSETTPRNDASPGNGGWDLDTAYRYVSEAYGGYHFDVLHGINVDAGIFMSYIGLFSYYNFDNWAYQPSYVSSNTPWFFNGVRMQIFPTTHLKIEPWFINGWQSYGSANNRPGLGGQLKWTPYSWMNIISNNYGYGHDDLFIPLRERIHTDNSVEVKYFDHPNNKGLDKMAFTFTGDLGCEYGGGVSCTGDHAGGPKQSFVGAMGYNRFWFKKDLYAVTIGGGAINNPGRYLVLLPPINGETAISAATNSPYFTENPGNPFKAWDTSITFDWMPKQYITFRWEYDYRHANVPYWSGRGGITPPGGENNYPGAYVCQSGAAAYNPTNNSDLTLPQAQVFCAANGNGGLWFPDLRKDENFIDMDILVKF